MKKNILELRNIVKQYDGNVILKQISFNIKENEFITILGPSGCGKTTILNIINGLENPSSGNVIMEGKIINKIPANKRNVNTIFQNYALFDHLTVFNNIAYGPKIKKIKYDVYKKEVTKYLELVGLKGYEDKKISQLSGGQKQRVAIARALINKPQILLLDEPMSALDVKLRKKMQIELKKIQEEVGITFILITHDQDEALTLSDRIIVLNDGVIQQIGIPEEIYNDPENLWTALFIGDSNYIKDGTFVKDYLVEIDGKEYKCLDRGFGNDERNIDIIIRPEDIVLSKKEAGFFSGEILQCKFKGVHWEIIVKTKHRNYLVHTTKQQEIASIVNLSWDEDAIHVMWKEIDE